MGKTRDLFKKIGDTKGTLYKDGHVKDRNNKDPTEAEKIKKRPGVLRFIGSKRVGHD